MRPTSDQRNIAFGYVIYEHRESLKRLPDSIWKQHPFIMSGLEVILSVRNLSLSEDLGVELRIGADIPVATSATLHLLALQLVVSQISSKVVRIAS